MIYRIFFLLEYLMLFLFNFFLSDDFLLDEFFNNHLRFSSLHKANSIQLQQISYTHFFFTRNLILSFQRNF